MSNNMMVLVMEYFDPEEIQYPHLYRVGIVPKEANLTRENVAEILPAMSGEFSQLKDAMIFAQQKQDEEKTEYGIHINNYGTLSSSELKEIIDADNKNN